MLDTVAESVATLLAEKAVSAAIGKREKVRLNADPAITSAAVRDHLNMVANWASEISFKDLLRSKKLVDSFIDLECRVGTFVNGEQRRENEKQFSIMELLNHRGHLVLLGRPGAGKTTSLQRVALSALESNQAGGRLLPLLVRLRDLDSSQSLVDHLVALIGLNIEYIPPKRTTDRTWESRATKLRTEASRRALTAFMEEANALLLLDGLDEAAPNIRSIIEREIQVLMEHSLQSRIFVTCRSADYNIHFRAESYSILPLTEQQVRKFAIRWLGRESATSFLDQLILSPYKGAEFLPLTVAHLCAIYERRGAIPAQPRSVYQKIVRLLLEEWDEQRGIRRESLYADFDVDRKHEFLRRIAYELTRIGCRGSFSHAQLERAYLFAHESFGLPRLQCSRVAREIESHSGLVLQSANDRYEFAHKSLQEFLCAEYLLRLPHFDSVNFAHFGNEFAIATALSSRAEDYLESIVERILEVWEARGLFASAYLSRLVTEVPDLPTEEWIGWTLLAAADVAHDGATQSEVVQSALSQSEPFARCMREAISRATCLVQGSVRLIAPRPHLVLSPKVANYLESRKMGGICISDEVFEILRNPNNPIVYN